MHVMEVHIRKCRLMLQILIKERPFDNSPLEITVMSLQLTFGPVHCMCIINISWSFCA